MYTGKLKALFNCSECQKFVKHQDKIPPNMKACSTNVKNAKLNLSGKEIWMLTAKLAQMVERITSLYNEI